MTVEASEAGDLFSGPDVDGHHTVPFWLITLGALAWRILAIVGLVVVVAGVAFAVGTVTASVIVAAVASITVLPVVRRLRDRGWGAGKAAAVGTLLAFGAIILVLGVGAVVFVRYGPELVAAIKAALADLHGREASIQLPGQIGDAIEAIINGGSSWLAANFAAIASHISTIFTVLLFGAFTTFYLLVSPTNWWPWITQGLNEQEEHLAAAVASAGAKRLGDYIRRLTVVAGVRALVSLVALALLGVPLVLALATLMFAASFVPYVGAAVATIAIMLAVLAVNGPGWAIAMLIVLVVTSIAIERALARRDAGWVVPVNPAVVLIAMLVGVYVAGLFGLLLAVPVAVATFAAAATFKAERPRGSLAPTPAGSVVPPWLDLLAGWSWRLLAGMALVIVIIIPIAVVPLLLVPLILAAVLAATLAPAVAALVRRGWGRTLASIVATVSLVGAVLILCGFALAVLVANVADIATKVVSGSGSVNDSVSGLAGVLTAFAGQVSGQIAQAVLGIAADVASFSVVMAVGIVLTFIALRDGREGWAALTSTLAPWRRTLADGAAGRAVSVLGGYMIATGVVSVVGAFTQFVIMLILGVPLALPVFVLSAFAGYIPYIGGMITTGIAVLLTITTGNPVAIAVMLIWTVVFNIVQGNIVQPLVFSKAVHIHPAIILLAIPAGNALGGILGMFLVVPILGVVAATWRTVLAVMGPPPSLAAAAATPGAEPKGSEP
jgi:putative heme transporter